MEENVYMDMARNFAEHGICASKNDGDVLGEDGLLRCGVCGEHKQAYIKGLDKPVPIMCRCVQERHAADEMRARQEQIERNRHECFSGFTEQGDATFAHDRGFAPNVSKFARAYVENFKTLRCKGMGFLLYGSVGTGKSFYGAAIANALIDRGYRVRCATLEELYRESRTGTARESSDFFSKLAGYDLVVVDDLGAEAQTTAMKSFAFSVIDTLYKSKTPLVVTTNASADEIKRADSVEYSRIYDRILERCPQPIQLEYSGGSVRRQLVRETVSEYCHLLGIS